MIIDTNTKSYETNSLFPNINWYNDDRIVIDETTEEGRQLVEKIINNYPFFDLVIKDGQLIDVQVYPDIEFIINKTQITTDEVATITITNPTTITAIINEQEYLIEDGVIEFSHYKVGKYEITLKADKFKPTIITIEVI